MAEREVKQWITVNGVHVPIFKGQSKEEAVKKALDNQKKSGSKTDKKEKSKEAEIKSKASEENTMANRNALKQKIDDYVKAHPNPTDEDRKKVSEMREKYNAMKKEAWDPHKKEIKEKTQVIKDTKQETIGLKQSIKDVHYRQALENYEADKYAAKETSTDNITDTKTHKELTDRLSKSGLKLDAADAHTIENSNSLNGEKVTMYDNDGNEYQGTYNKYSDGGREIINIKKTKDSAKKTALENEDQKQKDMARNKAEADKANDKTIFAQEYDEKISTYQNKFLKSKTPKQIDTIKKNLEKSGNMAGYTSNDHVALRAIEKEIEERSSYPYAVYITNKKTREEQYYGGFESEDKALKEVESWGWNYDDGHHSYWMGYDKNPYYKDLNKKKKKG